MKLQSLLAAVAGAATLIVAGSAIAAPPPGDYAVYAYSFYSDAAHTNLVGSGQTICRSGGDPNEFQIFWGSYSSHESRELEGVCRNGMIIYQ